jgi:uncharacterized protein (DUF1330 family)
LYVEKEVFMPAYVIAQVEVTDPELFAQYGAQVPATIEQYGGRYLVRGGQTEAIEGNWAPPRVVVIEFPSLDQLKKWYYSDEYKPLIALRQQSANTHLSFVEGYIPG